VKRRGKGRREEDASFHVKHSTSELHAATARIGFQLTDEAAERIIVFMQLLAKKAVPLGLISQADLPRLFERHILDSLRAAPLFTTEDGLAFDLGSGAGLPGIVLAIAVPDCDFLLIERRRTRVGFLELGLESLALRNVEVAPVRAEDLSPARLADVVTARAFAPLARTWRSASRLLRPSGRLIYFAGESLVDPLGEAERVARSGSSAGVRTERVLARSPPLVIMARR
jgi:16S rRNA (guanine527-N7)-methyltransferase